MARYRATLKSEVDGLIPAHIHRIYRVMFEPIGQQREGSKALLAIDYLETAIVPGKHHQGADIVGLRPLTTDQFLLIIQHILQQLGDLSLTQA